MTASKATLAIVFKYFQVVDLLMNFFGKINVRIGSDLEDKVKFLKNAELPKIGFLESLSLSNDGGEEETQNYKDRLEESKSQSFEKQETDQGTPENLDGVRILSETESSKNMMFFNDTRVKLRPPDEFYKFVDASKNTRNRLIVTNKDLFIIWG